MRSKNRYIQQYIYVYLFGHHQIFSTTLDALEIRRLKNAYHLLSESASQSHHTSPLIRLTMWVNLSLTVDSLMSDIP